jgi:Holliday junction DNA helicase RuvA
MDELEMFERLLSVSGIGPKSALLIMAEHSPARIVHAVKLADPTVLRVKGVGSKSLAKIVIELKGKLDDFVGLTEGGDATLDEQSGRFVHTGAGNQEDSELFSALENLGFSSEQIKQVIESVPKDETLGQQIKAALSLLRN